MKLKHLCLLVFILGIFISSCNETKEESKYTNWKERNELFIDSIASVYQKNQDPHLNRIEDSRNKGQFIYYKIIEQGSGEEQRPFLTSTVNVYYRGMLIDEETINKLIEQGEEPILITKAYKDLKRFDGNFEGINPDVDVEKSLSFTVNKGLINGFTEVLQHMHPGDRWEMYIPSNLGYGQADNGIIPGSSVLIFDLTLFNVKEY